MPDLSLKQDFSSQKTSEEEMLARLVIMELNKTYQEYSNKIIICYKQRVKYRGETVSVTEVWSLDVLTDPQDILTHGFPQELQ